MSRTKLPKRPTVFEEALVRRLLDLRTERNGIFSRVRFALDESTRLRHELKDGVEERRRLILKRLALATDATTVATNTH